MNSGYPRAYTPSTQNPLLFRHHTRPANPTNRPVRSGYFPAKTNSYSPYAPSPYSYLPPSHHSLQTPTPYNPQGYPYYALGPGGLYSAPNVTPYSTISSKGLALILIAILVLVALDLMIVRPQKAGLQVHSS